MKLLVTGGAGFIGSNFVLMLLAERPDVTNVNVDLLTYAGNLENLTSIESDAGLLYGLGCRRLWPGLLASRPWPVPVLAACIRASSSSLVMCRYLRSSR